MHHSLAYFSVFRYTDRNPPLSTALQVKNTHLPAEATILASGCDDKAPATLARSKLRAAVGDITMLDAAANMGGLLNGDEFLASHPGLVAADSGVRCELYLLHF